MKKTLHQIKLNDDEFKKIKKNKQNIILKLNDDDYKNVSIKDKVLLVNGKNKSKRRVKNLYNYSDVDELRKNIKNKQFGYKNNDIIDCDNLVKDYKKDEIKKYGLLGIEFNKNKHFFRKIVLGLAVIVLLIFGIRYINNKLDEVNSKKINKSINDLASERVDYAFIEINPYMMLRIKDNKVYDLTCLNEDCKKIYSDLDVKNKNINESIDLIYNVSKEKGFDTSNGVKVKMTGSIEVNKRDYIMVEYINETTKDEIISNIRDIKIENNSNDDYYSKLWEELKKDKDYDDVYTCSMNGKELECYFTEGMANYNIDDEFDISQKSSVLFNYVNGRVDKIANTFEKFGINVDKNSYGIRNQITLNNINFSFVLSYIYNDKTYNNVLKADMIDEWKNNEVVNVKGKQVTLTCPDAVNGMCQEHIGIYILPLNKVNLLDLNASFNNVIVHKNGNQSTKEIILNSIQ